MMDRQRFGPPDRVCVVDYNGDAAFRRAGYEPRAYPGVIPVPDSAIRVGGPLVIEPWHRELRLHAELFAVVGRDVAAGERDQARDAIAGYGLGLGAWSDGLIAPLRRATPRDLAMGTVYGYYWDGSRIQGSHLLVPGDLALQDLQLELRMPGGQTAAFPMASLIWDGAAILAECSRGIGFRRGEVICLGPVAPPVQVGTQHRFSPGDTILVAGGPFGELVMPIMDQREASTQGERQKR